MSHLGQAYCPGCGGLVSIRKESRQETYPVRGEAVTVWVEAAVCSHCGERVFHEQLDEANLERAYSVYRARNAILAPEAIREIRTKYNLSQRAFSRLLGFGAVTVHRYESGALPDHAHSNVIKLMQDPENMLRLLHEHGASLSPRQQSEALQCAETELYGGDLRRRLNLGEHPCMANGKRGFDLQRAGAVVSYFAHHLDKLWKTKLAKLLWYSDFLAFRSTGRSITGLLYAHQTYGPAPHRYDDFLGLLKEEGYITVANVALPGGAEGEVISSSSTPRLKGLSSAEATILRRVRQELGHRTAYDLTQLSHNEPGWRETKSGEIISYVYAERLSLCPLSESMRGTATEE